MSNPAGTEHDQAGTALDDQVRRDIRAAVADLVGTELDPVHDETPLTSLYERYDSLAVIDCVGQIEQRFAISIDLVDDDLRTTFASVTSIDELVRRKLADQAVLDASF